MHAITAFTTGMTVGSWIGKSSAHAGLNGTGYQRGKSTGKVFVPLC